MTEVMKALNSFFSQFGAPAYTEDGVPEDAVLPYITYTPVVTPWDSEAMITARVWDRSTSSASVGAIVDKIEGAIGEAIFLPAGSGYIHMYKGTPWAQLQSIGNPDYKVMYLNIGISTMI